MVGTWLQCQTMILPSINTKYFCQLILQILPLQVFSYDNPVWIKQIILRQAIKAINSHNLCSPTLQVGNLCPWKTVFMKIYPIRRQTRTLTLFYDKQAFKLP